MAHHIAKEGKLEETGRLQMLVHSLFAYYEPTILKILDRMIRIEFLRGRGKPLLVFTRKQLDFLPRGEIVSGQRTLDFIDAIANSQSSRISLSPCICQDALGIKKDATERISWSFMEQRFMKKPNTISQKFLPKRPRG
jgi:hypothetical protein